jgi:hypothetical protein
MAVNTARRARVARTSAMRLDIGARIIRFRARRAAGEPRCPIAIGRR